MSAPLLIDAQLSVMEMLDAKLSALRAAPLPADPATLILCDEGAEMVLSYGANGRTEYAPFPLDGFHSTVATTVPDVAEGFRTRFLASRQGDVLQIVTATEAKARSIASLERLIATLRPLVEGLRAPVAELKVA
jgi:hypothetical protein